MEVRAHDGARQQWARSHESPPAYTLAGSKLVEHLKEKKNPDKIFGKAMGDLQAIHVAYKKAFLDGDAMGSVVRLLAKCLDVPDAVRTDEQVREPFARGTGQDLVPFAPPHSCLSLRLLITNHRTAEPRSAVRRVRR